MKKIVQVLYMMTAVTVMSSCASKEKIVYFQGDTELNTIYEHSVPKIRPNDMLSITVSAADMKATQPFNQQNVYQVTQNGGQPNMAQNVYTVSDQGYIDFPVLGSIKIAGLTRNQAILLFKEKLSEYIVNPGVNINFTNFKVSVMGEVNSPGTFTLPNERITVLEALTLAGDLTITGVRNNVMVIREQDGKKQTYSIDLTSRTALDSPVYYLNQNDVVYVEPNKTRMRQSTEFNYPLIISVAGIIISVIAILIR